MVIIEIYHLFISSKVLAKRTLSLWYLLKSIIFLFHPRCWQNGPFLYGNCRHLSSFYFIQGAGKTDPFSMVIIEIYHRFISSNMLSKSALSLWSLLYYLLSLFHPRCWR